MNKIIYSLILIEGKNNFDNKKIHGNGNMDEIFWQYLLGKKIENTREYR